MATRAFVMQGIEYKFGDKLDTSAIEVRRLRQMYEQRMIDPILDAEPPKKAATPPKKPEGKQPPQEPAKAPQKAEAPVLDGFKNMGFGKWYRVDAEGNKLEGPFTKEQVEAMKKK